MRLTLRIMLAYLDEILEPADAHDVGQKIEESEFATVLRHRIRDVTRRLRLPAPKLEGRGVGLDPNTVAEYLDNTLPGERVPDIEKVFLESDVHLAEVASAHQILALVLGEKAEVAPESRARMYSLGAVVDSPEVAEPAGTRESHNGNRHASPQTVVQPTRGRTPRRRRRRRTPRVPEYLRETAIGGKRRYLLTGLVLLLVCVGAVLAIGPRRIQDWTGLRIADRWQPSTGLPTGPADIRTPATDGDGSQSAQPGVQPGTEGDGSTPDRAKGGQTNRRGELRTKDKERTATSDQLTTDKRTTARRASSKSATTKSTKSAPKASATKAGGRSTAGKSGKSASESNDGSASSRRRRGSKSQPKVDASAVPAVESEGELDGTAEKSKTAVDSAVDSVVGEPPADAAADRVAEDTGAEPVPPAPAVAAEGLGRLISEQDVLLRWDARQEEWLRLPNRQTVYDGDRLLALPTYRPSLALSSGVTLEVLGGSVVRLAGADAVGIPGVRVERGRAILLTVARPDTRVRLEAGTAQGVIAFGKEDTTVAIEVSRPLPSGGIAAGESSDSQARLYVAGGQVGWTGTGGEQAEGLIAPANRLLSEPPPAEAAAPAAEVLPAWITSDDLSQIRARASDEFEEYLSTDRPVGLTLKELVGHRRSEINILAIESLVEIDDFASVVDVLNDPGQKQAWSAQIVSVRSALTRGPEVIASIRDRLESQRGADGEELFRMFLGYSADDLAGGASRKLVDYLNHDHLDFRVLAFWNLREITGLSLLYRPADTEAKRRPHIQSWQQKLKAGQIVPRGKPVAAPG